MTNSDQPRPDLDAAIDAVVPSLTAVNDETAAASLRRTRIGLAEPRHAGGFAGWRWAIPSAALVATAIAAAFVWWPRAPIDAPSRTVVHAQPPVPAASLPAHGRPITPVVEAPRTVRSTRLARAIRIEATSAPRPDDTPPPDPLIALVRAVQEIPEDAWSAMARAQAPLATPGLQIEPIVVEPLVTPPIDGAPAASLAEGDR